MKRAKQILAIDIGASALKLAVLDILGVHFRLLKTSLKEFPESTAQKKEEFIKSSIHEFLANDVLTKQAYLVLSDPYVEIKRIDIPGMPLKEIPEAVKWKIKDKIPFNLEEIIIDSYLAGEFTNEAGSKQLAVMVAIAQRKELGSILSLLQELRLTVVGINAIPFGLANIIGYIKGVRPEKPVACVEIGAKHTYISIYKSNKLVFTRTIPVTSSQITDSMCGVLISDKGRIELSRDEAESIKRRFGLPRAKEEVLDGKISANYVIAMVKPILDQFVPEIKRTFTYYTSQLKGPEPNRIYLVGGGAKLKNLDGFLREELGIDVQCLGLPDRIENKTKEDSQSMLSFLGMIGAALPLPAGKVNLLPPELVVKKAHTIQKISIRMVGFTAIVILALSYIGVSIRNADYKKRLENAKSGLGVYLKSMDMQRRVSQRVEAVDIIKRGEVDGESLFKEISNIVPDSIILDHLTLDSDKREFIIRGILYTEHSLVEDELTKFMEQIERSSFFKEANLNSVGKDIVENKQIANFEINCILD